MTSLGLKGLLRVLSLLLILKANFCQDEERTCSRIPLHAKTQALPPDNRFVVEIENIDKEYIPGQTYVVRLRSTGNSTFIAFTIWAKGSTRENLNNPRKPIPLRVGQIQSSPDDNIGDTISSPVCENTVFQSNVLPKTSVTAQWVAPPKGNKCVTIYAYVAVKPDVWYTAEGPLSKKVCEDERKAEDMKPTENSNCQVCEDARYELRFQGTWSYNTHPTMYPTAPVVKFSDVVGASHNKYFVLYKDNLEATEGLKMLAEQGNTTTMEHEILKELGKNVRTVIKATGPSTSTQFTISSFRTTREYHFISLATSIIPSPDWFLGVYNLELCNPFNMWSKEVRYNLYPLDAGTDSGATFEAAQEVTIPPSVVQRAKITTDQSQDKMMPFAKLTITLVRTYERDDCKNKNIEDGDDTTTTEAPSEEGEGDSNEDNTRPPSRPAPDDEEGQKQPEPPSYNEPSESPDEDDCVLETWSDWSACEDYAPCVDNVIKGYKSRFRKVADKKKCLDIATSDSMPCEEPCTEQTTEGPEAQQGNWKDWVKPGQKWGSNY